MLLNDTLPQHGPDATFHASEAAATRIAAWLISVPVQRKASAHEGAVAAWIDDHRRAHYVYPEITGYYLQWLAWLAERQGVRPVHVERAASAQRWLARWLDSRHAPTRVYLDETISDWRNRATFTFDVAMVLRGIASAVRAQLVAPDRMLVERVCERLITLIADDGELNACARVDGDEPLPDRWSTRRGPFLAKAAAGILDASRVLNVPETLRQAADRTLDSAIAALLAQPHDETHPFLYAVEGFLALPGRSMFATRLPKVAEHVERLVRTTQQQRGHVPERSSDDGGPRRLDIVAQALRVGLLIDAHRPLSQSTRSALFGLRDRLLAHVRPDGGMPFDPDVSAIQLNVWTAMFAHQALAMAALGARELKSMAAAPRIV